MTEADKELLIEFGIHGGANDQTQVQVRDFCRVNGKVDRCKLKTIENNDCIEKQPYEGQNGLGNRYKTLKLKAGWYKDI